MLEHVKEVLGRDVVNVKISTSPNRDAGVKRNTQWGNASRGNSSRGNASRVNASSKILINMDKVCASCNIFLLPYNVSITTKVC